jgi:hypothetical protein
MALVYVYAMVSKKNGKCYVGTTEDPESRFEQHVCRVARGNHQCAAVRIHFADHSHGDVRFELLEKLENERVGGVSAARIAEARWIEQLGSVNKSFLKLHQIEVVDRTAEAIARAESGQSDV